LAAKGWGWYGLSLVVFLLALLSKIAVVMLPLVLLGCVWWRRGRVRWRDVLYSGPFWVCSLLWGLVSVNVMRESAVMINGPLSRVVIAGCVPWFYLYKALLPLDLAVIYPRWDINPSRLVSYLPGVLLIGCFAVGWRNHKTWGKPLLFGLGYFVVTLFPVLGFFDNGFYQYSLVADHWQYYSIVGVIALVIAAGEKICRRMGERGRHVGVLASVAVLVTLGAATWTRANVYKDEETLWRDNLAKNPNAWVARNNLGIDLVQAGKIQEAILQFEQALQIRPDYPQAHNNLGNRLAQSGRIQEAIAHYEQALRIKPDYVEAHNNLGVVLNGQGKVPQAIAHYEQALRIEPDSAEVHNNLGVALSHVGRVQDAIAHFEQALRCKPDSAEAFNILGNALLRTGKTKEAITHFEQALRIKPTYAEAHNDLGNALLRSGRIQDAINEYGQAVRLKPGFAEGHYNLANALIQTGQIQGAIEHYEAMLRIEPGSAPAHNNLGAALFQVGRVQDAIWHFEEALRLKPDDAEAQDNLARARGSSVSR
jgi:tetratricopeptide (TPR) repeat protein